MSYPNPQYIVKINTTRTIAPTMPEYLRTFAICSCGDTTLEVGKSQLVSQANYEDILNKNVSDNYTKKWLTSFFKNCIGKMALVVECGTSNTTEVMPEITELNIESKGLELEVGKSLQNTFDSKYNYTFGYADDDINSKNIFEINSESNQCELKGLKQGVGKLKVTLSGNDVSTTYFILEVLVKSPLVFDINIKIFDFNIAGTTANENDKTSRNYQVSENTNFTCEILKEDGSVADNGSPSVEVNGNSFVITTNTLTGNFKLKITANASANNMETILQYPILVKASGESLENTEQTPSVYTEITAITDISNHKVSEVKAKTSYIDVIKEYIAEEKETRAYKYSVPRQIMAHKDFLSLVETYSQVDSSVYFSGETIKNADPNTDAVFI